MLIPIGSGCKTAGDLPEWAIVELQGDIERRPEAVDGPNGELDVGSLSTSVRLELLFSCCAYALLCMCNRRSCGSNLQMLSLHKSLARSCEIQPVS